MSAPKHPRPAKLQPGRRELRSAVRGFVADWRLYTIIILVVSLPVDLASLSPTFSSDNQFTSYTQLFALIMNLALLWTIIRRTEGHKVSLAQAYYDGSASVLRYTLVSAALVAMLIPLGLGAALYSISLQSIFAQGPLSPEQILIALVSFIIALPSLFLLIRFGFGLVAMVHDDLRPVAALRRSWRLTRRRFWPVTGRFALLGLALVIISIPPTLIAAALALLHAAGWSLVAFELLATLLALPVANLYLVSVYRDLVATAPAGSLTAPVEPPII